MDIMENGMEGCGLEWSGSEQGSGDRLLWTW